MTFKISVFFIFAIFMTSCEIKPNKGKDSFIKEEKNSTPESENGGTITQATKDLIEQQNAHFPSILSELKENRKKSGHWIWWVFPTEKIGDSEPSPKTKIELDQVEYLLKNADMATWVAILEEINILLRAKPLGVWKISGNQPNPSIIPSIDHPRIRYALKFWLQTAGDKVKKYPPFYDALKNLDHFSW